MEKVYLDSSVPEKEAKRLIGFPENVMMENAAAGLESVLEACAGKDFSVIIFCGKGNNGGDGYALARRIKGKFPVFVYALGLPSTQEAVVQAKMARNAGVEIKDAESFVPPESSETVFVDCIYGTGFHGILPEKTAELIEKINVCDGIKIACDISSGISKNGLIETKNAEGKPVAFRADFTVTMGALKLALYTDSSIDFTGKIIKTELGLSDEVFTGFAFPTAFLLGKSDAVLPVRKSKASHKGNFGHAAVVTGEKKGAGIIAGTAALKSGAGLVTLVESGKPQDGFLMSPELMLSSDFPENTTAVLLGSGLGRDAEKMEKAWRLVSEKLFSMKNPRIVLDADMFYFPELEKILSELNQKKIQTVLTPHPKELEMLLKSCGILCEENKADAYTLRFCSSVKFSEKYENLTLVSKGAVTYIMRGKKRFIHAGGNPALSKAGSGDVLAGIIVSLLAQGYESVEAAKTAVLLHSEAAENFQWNYSLTPLSLIEKL